MPSDPRRPIRSGTALLLAVAGLALSSTSLLAQPASSGHAQPAAAARTAVSMDDLPIRRITLYRSGVGFFQRDGLVNGDARVPLRFKTDQINDILKSLVLMDLSGGRVDAVSYSSKDPLERRLASFGINIADNPTIPQLLERLRGSSVTISTPDGAISGTILGIENRTVPALGGDKPTTVQQPFANLITPAGIRSISLWSISSFQLADKQLQDELNKALAALAEYRAESTKSVDLSFSGEGARRVVVAYIHEMPVWKTSYRLILPDGNGTANIHGWAIVENTTDQDWDDVRLSLVAGRPVSFQMDLYEPLYAPRPTVPVPMIAGVMPRQYQGGIAGGLERAMADARKADEYDKATGRRMTMLRAPGSPAPAEAAPAMKSAGGGRGDAEAAYRLEAGADGLSSRDSKMVYSRAAISTEDLAKYAAEAQASGAEVGEVFQYELTNPVTIERQKSAMIPLVTSPIEARRVSIFSLADAANDNGVAHPMRGVELRNTTSLQLLPGPLAVFESGAASNGKQFDGNGQAGAAYAGDAQVGHIAPGDKRLLAYAVDLDVAAVTKPETTSTITKLKIVDGALEQTTKLRNTVTYAFENKDQKRPRTVLIEHPRLPNWDLAEPKKPTETTQGLYRFELDIDPGKTGTRTIIQERTESTKLSVLTYDLPTLTQWRQEGKVSEQVLAAYRDAAARQALVAESERAIAEIDSRVGAISQDQGRIRENMKTVDRNTDLYRRYATKLNDQETELEKFATTRADEQKRLETRRADLNNFLRNLSVE